jgi:hypothetical protein
MHRADIAINFSEKYPELNDEDKITKQLSREVVLDILHEKLKSNDSIKIKTIDDVILKELSGEIPEKIKTELGGTINFLSLLPNSNDTKEAVKEFYSKPAVLNNVKAIIGKINNANDQNSDLQNAIQIAIKEGGMNENENENENENKNDKNDFQNLLTRQQSIKPEKKDPISNFVDFVDVLLKAFGVDSLKPPSAKPGIRTKSGSKGEKSNSFVDELINLCCPTDTKRRE